MRNFSMIIILILSSCTVKSENFVKKDFDFSKEVNFDKFRIKLQEYARNNPYPNINN